MKDTAGWVEKKKGKDGLGWITKWEGRGAKQKGKERTKEKQEEK